MEFEARVADLVARATTGRPCAADSPTGLALFFLNELEVCGVPEELRDVMVEARRCVIEGEAVDPVVARLTLGLDRMGGGGGLRSCLGSRAHAMRNVLKPGLPDGVEHQAHTFAVRMTFLSKVADAEVLASPAPDWEWSGLQLGWGSRPHAREGIEEEILASLDQVARLSASFAVERDVLSGPEEARAGGVPPKLDVEPFPEYWGLDLAGSGYGYEVESRERAWFSAYARLGVDLPSPVPGNGLRLLFTGRRILPDLYEPETMHAVMEALVRQWKPDWAAWAPRDWPDYQVEDVAGVPLVGWGTYLADGGRPVDGSTVRTLPGLPGAVYTVEKDYASTTLGDVLGLRERLRGAGVLRSPIEGVRW